MSTTTDTSSLSSAGANLRGAVILGGLHGSLALGRSLRALDVPVTLITSDNPLPRFSRCFKTSMVWAGAGAPDALDQLEALADSHGLNGQLLIAAGDAEVRLVSEHHDRLARRFVLTLPPWARLAQACDKALAYGLAEHLGIGYPKSYAIADMAEAQAAQLKFPLVLKPTQRLSNNRFTLDKAWRVDDRAAFLAAYAEAASLVGQTNVVVQDLIPGGGEGQLSYAGLWIEGREAAGFTARRTRQYPLQFSYTSTFVEVVDAPDVAEAARRFLSAIGHHGLVEVEFKRDARDGTLKLLDINPRPWSWFGLAEAAGLDLGAMLWFTAQGQPPRPGRARPGVAWMFLVRDMVAAGALMRAGQLSPGAYLQSFGRVRSWATFALSDPLPGVMDVPLTLMRIVTRRLPLKRRL